MQDSKDSWSTEDFDQMSWHDVHVHGFRLEENEGNNGSAELFLDIDYILEWINEDKGFSFVLAQATLQFHEIFGLKFTLDYATPTSGMCAFSLGKIERERIAYPTDHISYKWNLEINWPSGQMEFLSPGFSQWLVGKKITQGLQCLAPAQRNVIVAV